MNDNVSGCKNAEHTSWHYLCTMVIIKCSMPRNQDHQQHRAQDHSCQHCGPQTSFFLHGFSCPVGLVFIFSCVRVHTCLHLPMCARAFWQRVRVSVRLGHVYVYAFRQLVMCATVRWQFILLLCMQDLRKRTNCHAHIYIHQRARV